MGQRRDVVVQVGERVAGALPVWSDEQVAVEGHPYIDFASGAVAPDRVGEVGLAGGADSSCQRG